MDVSDRILAALNRCEICKRQFDADEGVGVAGKTSIHWVHESCLRRYKAKRRSERKLRGKRRTA